MGAKIAELRAQMEQLRAERDDHHRQRRKVETHAALVAAGITGPGIGIALSHLEATGSLRTQADGSTRIAFEGRFGDEESPVAEGIAAWLQTPDGGLFRSAEVAEVAQGEDHGGANERREAPRMSDGSLDTGALAQVWRNGRGVV